MNAVKSIWLLQDLVLLLDSSIGNNSTPGCDETNASHQFFLIDDGSAVLLSLVQSLSH